MNFQVSSPYDRTKVQFSARKKTKVAQSSATHTQSAASHPLKTENLDNYNLFPIPLVETPLFKYLSPYGWTENDIQDRLHKSSTKIGSHASLITITSKSNPYKQALRDGIDRYLDLLKPLRHIKNSPQKKEHIRWVKRKLKKYNACYQTYLYTKPTPQQREFDPGHYRGQDLKLLYILGKKNPEASRKKLEEIEKTISQRKKEIEQKHPTPLTHNGLKKQKRRAKLH